MEDQCIAKPTRPRKCDPDCASRFRLQLEDGVRLDPASVIVGVLRRNQRAGGKLAREIEVVYAHVREDPAVLFPEELPRIRQPSVRLPIFEIEREELTDQTACYSLSRRFNTRKQPPYHTYGKHSRGRPGLVA